MKHRIDEIGRRVLSGRRLTRTDVLKLAKTASQDPHEVMYWAHRVRQQNFGNAVRLCSIIPGKLGGCPEDCKWCAQSIHSKTRITPSGKSSQQVREGWKPSRTGADEISAAVKTAAENGAASIGIVNSGPRPTQPDLDQISEAVRSAKSDNPCEIEFCASLGELTNTQAEQLAAAGITRYHHNLETSRTFFPKVVSSHPYERRITTLTAARNAGMRICCGGLMGLGETWEDRVDLALTIRDEIHPDETPLNFLQPVPGTPLQDATPLPPMEILGIIAVFRLVLPKVNLKIAGGREYNLRDLQSWAFYAGATGCIIGNYLTTTGRSVRDDLRMLADLELTIVKEFPIGV